MTLKKITDLKREHIFGLIGYKPTVKQWELHNDTHRIQLIAGGVRFGKSLYSAHEGLWRILAGGPAEEYWLVAADYSRSTQEFNYIVEAASRLGLLKECSRTIDPRQPRRILLGFASTPDKDCWKVFTRSATDPIKLASTAPKGIIGCEFSQADYETYLRCRERLVQKNGWFLMSGSFETSLGWYPETFKYWQVENDVGAKSFSCPSWENTLVFPGGRDDPKIKKAEAEFSKERFMERFGGVPCPPSGGVFTGYFANAIHVRDDIARFDKDKEVLIFIDPGYAGAYAVEAAQRDGDKIHLIDEVYLQGYSTGGPSGIIQVCRNFSWWDSVRRGTVDIAGMAHRPEGPPVAETWLKEAGIRLTANKVGISDGIDRLRAFLMPHPVTKEPRLYVNSKCRGFISECGGGPNPITHEAAVYRYKTDGSGNVIGREPVDANNHSVKAVIYGIIDEFGYAQRLQSRVVPPISYIKRRTMTYA